MKLTLMNVAQHPVRIVVLVWMKSTPTHVSVWMGGMELTVRTTLMIVHSTHVSGLEPVWIGSTPSCVNVVRSILEASVKYVSIKTINIVHVSTKNSVKLKEKQQ